MQLGQRCEYFAQPGEGLIARHQVEVEVSDGFVHWHGFGGAAPAMVTANPESNHQAGQITEGFAHSFMGDQEELRGTDVRRFS